MLSKCAALACLTAAASVLALPSAAEPFRAMNHMTVASRGDAFEVTGNPEIFARDYWCAAGDYAQRVLDLPVTARLVVTDPYVRGSRSVSFAADPDAAPQFGVVVLGLSVRNAGSSLSVGQARGFCADYRLRRSY